MKIVEFKDYDNQTTPLSAYNLNRLQQNLITTKYQMTFSSAVSGGSTITLPCYYQVGQDTLDVYLNSELLKKASTKDSEGHYYEVGNRDTKSNQIKITSDWSIASGDVLNLIVRGTTDSYDQNLSPDKATQLADEISANKEEITALQTENSRQQKVIDQLPQVTGQGTEVTLENTIEAPFTNFDIEGNSKQDGTPSPDNEVPIYSAGDNGSINVVICNKNILIPEVKSTAISSYNNNTYTFKSDLAITWYGYIAKAKVEAGKTYVLSFEGNFIYGRLGISRSSTVHPDNDNYYKIKLYSGNKKTIIIPEIDQTIYIWFCSDTNRTNLNSFTISLQLEEGSIATDYEEHKEQSFTIPAQQPFRSIGDVRDKFVKVNGNWFERHYINRLILNGTESWEMIGTNTTGKYRFQTKVSSNEIVNNQDTMAIMQGFCNRLIMGTPTTTYLCQTGITTFSYTSLGYLIIYNEKATDTFDNFKAWLSSNNLTVDYLLKTPIDIECTEEQIEALENLPSTYKDFTTINSEDETPAYLEVSGIYDLNNLINNFIRKEI